MSGKESGGLPTSPPAAGTKMSTQHVYAVEIQQMMHGLGDCHKPLHESAVLIEEIVHQQMTALLYKVAEIAVARNSRFIGLEDILFLMRKDKIKLRRLLRLLQLKDTKSVALQGTSVDEEDASDLSADKVLPVKKRKKMCMDFLSSIDQTGELTSLFDDDTPDDVKNERLLRADLVSRGLNPQQYMEFCESRQANFSKKFTSQRFKDWLLSGVSIDVKPNNLALEILSYLTYETVAQIVDLALLVKQDKRAHMADPLSLSYPSSTHNFMYHTTSQSPFSAGVTSPSASSPSTPSTPSLGLVGSTSAPPTPTQTGASSTNKVKSKKRKRTVAMEVPLQEAISPADIREAMRRYTNSIGPFVSQMKVNSLSGPRTILLCT
ncbi:hypothetical protein CHS0354_033685 [Potamilus streckersoni]|uniref:Transcription initiation protein SPT3 homolog n=1 Tax=Potamilus streckersoni TaxID=2493646 RepID=A0AAE0S2C5_9BIVA|nr:hypothetical protein CHS0354_033685 [Potamilus streckersoni]